ncbi:hypothetical protein FO440_17500 [Mucilaginibacter corticis]|uniref:Uncharacterized protein n=1 Tax=Mucilaginibacter corticis TaxID=2597670 RepID=A0A556MHZ4_9SPHI|nr:hypothetical protein [Mucilaginibacter corticis]TSJ39537.1 hypothetical protein FO440_17500 [Mucilaginibacter corticis]
MRKIVSFLVLFLLSIPAFCQLIYTQNLKQIAQINFPGQPVVKELPNGITMYYLKVNSEIYFAQVASYKKTLSQLFTNNVNQKIYDTYIHGNVNTAKGKLLYKKKISIANLDAVAYTYTSKLPKKELYAYSRLVFLNDKLLNISLLSRDSLPDNDTTLNAYFNSLKINIPANKIVTDNGPELLSRFGYVIGIAAILLAGVILVYKRSLQRKNLS